MSAKRRRFALLHPGTPPAQNPPRRALRAANRVGALKTHSLCLGSKFLPSPRLGSVAAYALETAGAPAAPPAPPLRGPPAPLPQAPCRRGLRGLRGLRGWVTAGMGGHGGHRRSRRAWELMAGIGGHCGHGRSRRAWEVTASHGEVTASHSEPVESLHWDARKRKRCARVGARPNATRRNSL